MTIFVPVLSAPATITHGRVATVTVSSCPSRARVVLSLSDGRSYDARATTGGLVTFRLPMPTARRVVLGATIDNVHVRPTRTIVVT
jgi:hypothetical protein